MEHIEKFRNERSVSNQYTKDVADQLQSLIENKKIDIMGYKITRLGSFINSYEFTIKFGFEYEEKPIEATLFIREGCVPEIQFLKSCKSFNTQMRENENANKSQSSEITELVSRAIDFVSRIEGVTPLTKKDITAEQSDSSNQSEIEEPFDFSKYETLEEIEIQDINQIPFENVKKEKLIFEGGQGSIFSGLYKINDKETIPVALKSYKNDNKTLQKECILANDIKSDYIIHVYGIWNDQETDYLVLEKGDMTLSKKIQSEPRMTLEEVYKCLLSICLGIRKMHEHSIIHRDIKTDNIIYVPNKGWKLIDFGISKEIVNSTNAVAQTCNVGTLLYMAPEIHKNEPYTIKADIWSLACVMIECLICKQIYSELNYETIGNYLNEGLYPLISTAIPEKLRQILYRCFDLDSKRPSIEEIIEVLIDEMKRMGLYTEEVEKMLQTA